MEYMCLINTLHRQTHTHKKKMFRWSYTPEYNSAQRVIFILENIDYRIKNPIPLLLFVKMS